MWQLLVQKNVCAHITPSTRTGHLTAFFKIYSSLRYNHKWCTITDPVWATFWDFVSERYSKLNVKKSPGFNWTSQGPYGIHSMDRRKSENQLEKGFPVDIYTSPFAGRKINKRNILQYIIHSTISDIQKLLINISINFQTMSDACWTLRLKNEIPPGRRPLRLHSDGSNNMRWVLALPISAMFSTFQNFRQNIGKLAVKVFLVDRFVFLLPSSSLQNETNFHTRWKCVFRIQIAIKTYLELHFNLLWWF